MKEKIVPSLVLTIIASVVCGLLVLANALTKDKIQKAQEEKISASLSETFGDARYSRIDVDCDGVNGAYAGDNGKTIVEVTADGYAKGGIHVLIGFDETDAVCGIGFLDLSETPGLGTKIRDDKSFPEQFMGITESPDQFVPITGATFSSNGMKSAVDLALETYNDIKGGSEK